MNKNPAKDKFDERGREGIFVGYPKSTKGYRIYIPGEHKIIEARDVIFREKVDKFKKVGVNIELLTTTDIPEKNSTKVVEVDIPQTVITKPRNHDVEFLTQRECEGEIPGDGSESLEQEEYVNENSSDSGEHSVPILKRARGRPKIVRGKRGRPRKIYQMVKQKKTSDDENKENCEESNTIDKAFLAAEISLEDALSSDDCQQWQEAICSEIRSLVKNDTWDIVKKPKDRDVVGCRYVLTTKFDANMKRKKKAPLVARGFSQSSGIDCHRTYAAHVARMETKALPVCNHYKCMDGLGLQ